MNSTSGPFAPREPRPEGRRWSAALRQKRLWSGLLAATAVLALLAAFHHVVRAGVGQGATRRQAVAALADATWRCQSLRGSERVRACLDALAAPSVQPGADRGDAARPAVLPAPALRSDGDGSAPAPQSTSTNTQPSRHRP